MEFPALVNIGLTSANGFVEVGDILEQFKEWHVELHQYRVHIGDGGQDEDTFIAHVEDWSDGKAWIIADSIGQDCIAQYDLSLCKGALVGPLAQEWGTFEVSRFKLL